MSYIIEAKVKKKGDPEAIKKMIRGLGGAILQKHALGMATALYQVYPVGPESVHVDGSPHTRDTFAIVQNDGTGSAPVEGANVLASKGQFASVTKKFDMQPGRRLSFITAGASFFLEFGTVFQEAQVLIRPAIKRARAAISKDLRALNISQSKL